MKAHKHSNNAGNVLNQTTVANSVPLDYQYIFTMLRLSGVLGVFDITLSLDCFRLVGRKLPDRGSTEEAGE
jgi:hypothetical protein